MANTPPIVTQQQLVQLALNNAEAAKAQLKTLPEGTTLIAKVIQSTPNTNQLKLQIGQQLVSANSSLPLKAGDNVQVKIQVIADQVILKVLPNPKGTQVQVNKTDTLLASVLPKQASLSPLLANMSEIQKLIPTGAKIPRDIKIISNHLMQQLPDSKSIATPEGLKQAIKSSGVFLENMIATTQNPSLLKPLLRQDFKANLLRLIQTLNRLQQSETKLSPNKTDNQVQTGQATQANNASLQKHALLQPPMKQHFATSQPGREGIHLKITTPAKPVVNTPLPQVQVNTPQISTTGQSQPTQSTAQQSSVQQYQTTQGQTTTGTSNTTQPQMNIPFKGNVPQPQAQVAPNLPFQEGGQKLVDSLLQQVTAAVARVQLSQIASVPDANPNTTQQFTVEIPVKHNDEVNLFQVKVEESEDDGNKSNAEDEQTSSRWMLTMAFDLPHLGPLQVQVAIRPQHVNTIFWAQEKHAHDLINQWQHSFKDQLEAEGIKAVKVQVEQGQLQQTNKFPHSEQIVSVKA